MDKQQIIEEYNSKVKRVIITPEEIATEIAKAGKQIKVLSLFFIDKVANYRQYDEEGNPVKGPYAQIFEEEYKKVITQL